ncbi:hypothetical protein [Sporosarcina koreensis]|uniref:hypothetical protein n=1 Tax=Bacillales TaxID=1385 RepID=UPI0007588B3D|nr:hypothetical protein [Sporosarcina koreensis]
MNNNKNSGLSNAMFILMFFVFIVGLLMIFDLVSNLVSGILMLTLFGIAVIIKIVEMKKTSPKNGKTDD